MKVMSSKDAGRVILFSKKLKHFSKPSVNILVMLMWLRILQVFKL